MSGSTAQSANAKKKQRQRAKAAAAKATAGAGDATSAPAPETPPDAEPEKEHEQGSQPLVAEESSSTAVPETVQVTAARGSELEDAAVVSEPAEKGHSEAEHAQAIGDSAPKKKETVSSASIDAVDEDAAVPAAADEREVAVEEELAPEAPAAPTSGDAIEAPSPPAAHARPSVPEKAEAKDDMGDPEAPPPAPESEPADGQILTERKHSASIQANEPSVAPVSDPDHQPLAATKAEPIPVPESSHVEANPPVAVAPDHEVPSTSAQNLFRDDEQDDDPFATVAAGQDAESALHGQQQPPQDTTPAEYAQADRAAPPQPAVSAMFADATAETDPFAEVDPESDHVSAPLAQHAEQDTPVVQAQSPLAGLDGQRDVPQQAASHLFSMDADDDAFGQIGGQQEEPTASPRASAEAEKLEVEQAGAPAPAAASELFGGADDVHDDPFATIRGDDNDPVPQLDVEAENLSSGLEPGSTSAHPAGLFGEAGEDDPFATIGGHDDVPAAAAETTYDGKFDDLLAEFEEYTEMPAEPVPASQPNGHQEARTVVEPDAGQATQEAEHVGDASMRSMFTDGGDWLADTSIDDSFDLGAIRGEASLEPESPIAGGFLDRTPPSRNQPLPLSSETESGAELIEPVIPEGWFNDQGEFVYYTTEEKEAVRRAMLGESEGQASEQGTGLAGFGGLRTSQSENSARRTPILPEPAAQQPMSPPASGPYDPYAPAPSTKPAVSGSVYSPYSAPASSAPGAPYGQPTTAYTPSPYDPYASAPQAFQAFAGAGPSQRSVSAAPTSTSAKPAVAPPPKPQRIVSNAYDPPLRPSKSFVRAPSAAVAATNFTPPPLPALSPPPAPPSAPPAGPPKRAKTPAAAPPPALAGLPKGPPPTRQSAAPPPGPPSSQPQARADDAYAPAPAGPPPVSADAPAQRPPTRPPSAAASAKPAFSSFDPPMRPPSAAKMASRAPSRLAFSPPPANLGMTPAAPPPAKPVPSAEGFAPPPQRLEPAQAPPRSDRPISRNPSGMFELPPPQRPPSGPAFDSPPPQRPPSGPAFEAPPPQQPPSRPAFEAAPPQRPPSRPAFEAPPPQQPPSRPAFEAAPPQRPPSRPAFEATPPQRPPSQAAFEAPPPQRPPSRPEFSSAPPPRPPSVQHGPPLRSASPMSHAAPPPLRAPVMQVSKREEDAWRGGYGNEEEEEEEEVQPGAEEEDWSGERTAAAQSHDEEDVDEETGDVSTVSREARRSTGGSDSLEASFSGLSLASRDEPCPPQRSFDDYGPPSHAPPPPQQLYSPPRAPARPEQRSYDPYQPTSSYEPGPPAPAAPSSDPYAPQASGPRTSTDSYNPYAPPPVTKPRSGSGSVQQGQPPSTFSPAVTVMQIPRNDPYGRMTPPPAGNTVDYGTSPAAPNYFRSMEAAAPLDPTYVPQQILEQRPVSEDALGRSTPAARHVPLAVFGFGGVLITCFPGARTADGASSAGYSHARAPSYGYASGSNRLYIRPIADVVPSAALKFNEAVFPGPLVLDSSGPKGAAGEKKRREAVTAYLSARAQEIEQGLPYLKSAASAARREQEGKLVIVRLLAAMILGEGKLSGNPKVEEAVRAALSDPATMSSRPMLSPTSLAPPNLSSQHYGSSRASGSSAPSAATAATSQLTQLSEMLMAGDKRGAAEYAAAQSLWSHALVIASSAGPDAWKDVVGRFVAAELGHQSHAAGLKAAYTLYSGRMADSVDDLMAAANITSDPSNDRWRDVLSAVVFNSTPPQLACLDELGHRLMTAGLINAAQACFILSPSSPFGIVTHAAFDKPILLLKGIKDEDAIIFAEIAEYARSMITVPKGQEAPFPGLPQLLPYKLQRAWVAAEQGDAELAKRYCNAVDAASKIGKNGPTVLPGHLVASLEDVLERLTGTPTIDPKKTFAGRKASSKPALDSFGSWIEGRLTKFIAGEEDAPAAGGASAPPPPSSNKEAKAEVPVGPFSHFSTISPALTEASRNPSLLDMSTAGGHLGVPGRQTSPFPGQASPQRAAPIPIREPSTVYPAAQQGSSWDSWRGGDQAAATDGQSPAAQAEEDTPAVVDDYEGEFINPMAGFSLNTIAPTPPADNYAPPAASASRDYIDEEDEDDLGFGNNALKPKSNPPRADGNNAQDSAPAKSGKPEQPAAAAAASAPAAKPAAADSAQPAAQEKKGWFGGWLGGGKKKGADVPASGPVRAKLGEENSMVFDPVQKRWIVKGAKAEATPPATPPPPPRAQTASPAARPPQSTPPASAGPPSAPPSAPPPARPPGFAEGPDGGIRRMKSSLAESVTASNVGAPPGPPSAGGAGGPPPRAATAAPGAAAPGVKPPSLDDLLSRPPSKRPGSVASRKGAKNRYVDVFQQ